MSNQDNKKNLEEPENHQIAFQNLMDLVDSSESSMKEIAEHSNILINVIESMNERLENIESELSDLRMDVDMMKSDVGSIETNLNCFETKLDVGYLDKHTAEIQNNAINITSAAEDEDEDEDEENSLLDYSASSSLNDDDEEDDNYSFGLEDEADDDDGDWDYQEEDKTCEMCAGTGFMGASEEEGDETGCDEVTCPFCMGSGIK